MYVQHKTITQKHHILMNHSIRQTWHQVKKHNIDLRVKKHQHEHTKNPIDWEIEP